MGGKLLSRCFCKKPEHRKNQRFSLEIVGFRLACGVVDLFPYLREPRKARKIRIRISVAETLADPAVDAVDKRTKRRAITAAERIAECMQLNRVDLRKAVQQCRRPLTK